MMWNTKKKRNFVVIIIGPRNPEKSYFYWHLLFRLLRGNYFSFPCSAFLSFLVFSSSSSLLSRYNIQQYHGWIVTINRFSSIIEINCWFSKSTITLVKRKKKKKMYVSYFSPPLVGGWCECSRCSLLAEDDVFTFSPNVLWLLFRL